MNIDGSRMVKIVSDGTFSVEGGALFGIMPRPEWELRKRPDRKNRVKAGLNCMVVSDPVTGTNVLINTGMGNRYPAEMRERYARTASKLNANLRNVAKLTPREITHIFFTSMHYHNTGGAFRLNKDGDLTLNFPKAVHMVHRKSFEEAMAPNMLQERELYGLSVSKFREDIELLQEKGKLLLIDEPNYEIIPGVTAEEVGGFGNGHSIVWIIAGSERFVYPGNLFPTELHREVPVLTVFDRNPEETMQHKNPVLQKAMEEGYICIFPNDHETAAAYIMGDNRIRPVAL